jgi:hypothetical protein
VFKSIANSRPKRGEIYRFNALICVSFARFVQPR